MDFDLLPQREHLGNRPPPRALAARSTTDGFPEAHLGRELQEILAAKWLGGHGDDYTGMNVRFDDVAMMVMDGTRPRLRAAHVANHRAT